ncbi:NAD(P)/FAD-dependent oxidoreductase [Motilibacter peucedani]|uniref:NAD(P)/FAD-dependent oxidoreductase n=1 Tax=Motilibacter peucedani TaxID=598650 RepID=UPI000EAF83FE
MSPDATVAVVGASLAGLSAVRALRTQGHTGTIVVVGEESHRPYDRPPLSKGFLAGTTSADELRLEAPGEDLDVDWRLGTRATALDAATRTLALETTEGPATLTADGVVLATGATARPLPGSGGLAGVYTVRTLDDAEALRAELLRASRLVVVGAGFVGAEVASTARGLGLEVTVVEALTAPLAGPLGARMGAVVASLHERHGVRLLCGSGVSALHGTSRVEAVELADGRLLPADVVVVGIGAVPATDWLHGSGLALGDGVLCDAGGLTSAPGVVAVGDCAAWWEDAHSRHRRVEHWSEALERPAVAVAGLLAGESRPGPRRPHWFWSEQYDTYVQFAGSAGLDEEVTVEVGELDEHRFVAAYRAGGRLTAVLGMGLPKEFRRWRKELERSVAAEAGVAESAHEPR